MKSSISHGPSQHTRTPAPTCGLVLTALLLLAGCDGTTGTPDAAPADGGICEGMGDPVPLAEPASREVRFNITGPSDTYVVTQATDCAAFGVDDLQLALPFNCGCECAPFGPSLSGPRIEAGVTLNWDGESLATYSACLDCSSGFTGSEVRGVGQAVAAGTHTLTLLVADSVPSGCDGGGLLRCQERAWSGEVIAGGDGRLCSWTGLREVSVEFELPATGDVEFDVIVPPLE